MRGEYQEIKDQIRAEQEMYQPTWTQILKKPSWRKRIILVCLLQTFAQLTGINCIKYYAGKQNERTLICKYVTKGTL